MDKTQNGQNPPAGCSQGLSLQLIFMVESCRVSLMFSSGVLASKASLHVLRVVGVAWVQGVLKNRLQVIGH